MTKPVISKRWLSILALGLGLLLGPLHAQEEGDGELPAAGTDVLDQGSLRRGARLFFNYCVGCHSLKYMRYSRIAEDLGLSEAEVMGHFNVTGANFGETVISHMPAEAAQQFFGKAPPDLSLEVRAKSADWVFAYLNRFYLDPSRPVGWNNTLFPNVSMPHPLWELQGLQTAERKPGSEQVARLTLSQPGTLSPAHYRAATRDLTAFLEYVAEPASLQRHHYGVWVLLFLCLLAVLLWLLKREYWKDMR